MDFGKFKRMYNNVDKQDVSQCATVHQRNIAQTRPKTAIHLSGLDHYLTMDWESPPDATAQKTQHLYRNTPNLDHNLWWHGRYRCGLARFLFS